MTRILTPTSRDEWLALRRGYISSTESAALFGYSPYLTAYELGISKKADSAEAGNDTLIGNDRTKWGLRLQDTIAQGIADDYGVQILPMGLTYAVRDEIRMGSSFDYQIIGSENLHPDLAGTQLIDMFQRLGPGLLEVKNVDSLVFKRQWIDDEAPAHIEIQLQHQLETLELPWGAIAFLVGGNKAGIFVRERDVKFGTRIVMRVGQFWRDFDRGVLPDPQMPEDAQAVIDLYNYAEPEKVYDGQEDAELLALVADYEQHRAIGKKADELKKVAQAKILQKVGAAERILVPGFTLTASMVASTVVKEYKRSAYRNFRLTAKKAPANEAQES